MNCAKMMILISEVVDQERVLISLRIVDHPSKDSFKEFYNSKDASSKEKTQISSTDTNEVIQWVLIFLFLLDDILKWKYLKHDFKIQGLFTKGYLWGQYSQHDSNRGFFTRCWDYWVWYWFPSFELALRWYLLHILLSFKDHFQVIIKVIFGFALFHSFNLDFTPR